MQVDTELFEMVEALAHADEVAAVELADGALPVVGDRGVPVALDRPVALGIDPLLLVDAAGEAIREDLVAHGVGEPVRRRRERRDDEVVAIADVAAPRPGTVDPPNPGRRLDEEPVRRHRVDGPHLALPPASPRRRPARADDRRLRVLRLAVGDGAHVDGLGADPGGHAQAHADAFAEVGSRSSR